MSRQFQWHPKKAAKNARKHKGVKFEEAATVFREPLASIFDAPNHSDQEYREWIIGHSNRNRLLIVSFTERNDVIRSKCKLFSETCLPPFPHFLRMGRVVPSTT